MAWVTQGTVPCQKVPPAAALPPLALQKLLTGCSVPPLPQGSQEQDPWRLAGNWGHKALPAQWREWGETSTSPPPPAAPGDSAVQALEFCL